MFRISTFLVWPTMLDYGVGDGGVSRLAGEAVQTCLPCCAQARDLRTQRNRATQCDATVQPISSYSTARLPVKRDETDGQRVLESRRRRRDRRRIDTHTNQIERRYAWLAATDTLAGSYMPSSPTIVALSGLRFESSGLDLIAVLWFAYS